MLQNVIINRIHTFGEAFTWGGGGRGGSLSNEFLFTGSGANNWGAFKWGLLYPWGSLSNIYFVYRKIG